MNIYNHYRKLGHYEISLAGIITMAAVYYNYGDFPRQQMEMCLYK